MLGSIYTKKKNHKPKAAKHSNHLHWKPIKAVVELQGTLLLLRDGLSHADA